MGGQAEHDSAELETGPAEVSLGWGLPHEEQRIKVLMFPHVC